MNDFSTLRVPPHSDEAETAFLCAVLERNSLVDDVESILMPESFYRHENQILFRRMRAMALINQPIDTVTLANALDDAGEYTDHMAHYLIDLVGQSRGAANALHYARMIQDKHTDRTLIAKGHEITDIAYSEGTTAEKLDKAQSIIMESGEQQDGDAISINEGLHELVEHIDFLHKNKGELLGIATGFEDIDRLFNGLQESKMIVIGGRPGHGKTTLAMNICEYAAIQKNKTVLVFSLEMDREELLMRATCSIKRIPHNRLSRGQMQDQDWPALTAGIAMMKDKPLFIDDRPSLTSEQMLSRARKLSRKIGKKIDLIVVDYIQLMTDKGEGEQRVSKISRNIKLAAKTLKCPIIAISQLSRKCEERPDKRPIASDLRDSGAIEQDADIIGFVYRDEVYNPERSDRKGVTELLVRKHRKGETGTVYLTTSLQYCRFDSNVGYVPPAYQQAPRMRGISA